MSVARLAASLTFLSQLLSNSHSLPADACEADCVRNDHGQEPRWAMPDTDGPVSTQTFFCRLECKIARNQEQIDYLDLAVSNNSYSTDTLFTHLQNLIDQEDNDDHFPIASLAIAGLGFLLTIAVFLRQLCQDRRPRPHQKRRGHRRARLHLYRQPAGVEGDSSRR